MNATKRFLTAAAIAAGALGIGVGAFFACRQELSPGAQSGSANTERRPGDAKYDDGIYVFHFKIGSWIRKERNKVKQALEAAGISTLKLGDTVYSHIIVDASKISWFAYNQ